MAKQALTLPSPAAAGEGLRIRIEPQTAWCSAVLLLVGLLSCIPGLIVVRSFDVAQPGESSRYSLDAWRTALTDSGVLTAVWNTVRLTFAREAISFPIAVAVAWLLARTNIPGSHCWSSCSGWPSSCLPCR